MQNGNTPIVILLTYDTCLKLKRTKLTYDFE